MASDVLGKWKPDRIQNKISKPNPKPPKEIKIQRTLFMTNTSSKLTQKNFRTQNPQLAARPLTNVGLVIGNTRKVFGNSTNSDKQQSITNYWKNLLCNKTLMVGGLIKRKTISQKIPITIFGTRYIVSWYKNEILGSQSQSHYVGNHWTS